MIKKRKICVVSSSRADYNHLYLLLKNLNKSKFFNLQIVVTGMHLIKKYGETYKEIMKDGFKVDAKILTKQKDTTLKQILESMSNQFKNVYSIFSELRPDIIVILGDRYDILPIAIGAQMMGIPIAHFHGGEVTYGVIDDSIRHAITKMSDIHFVANNFY